MISDSIINCYCYGIHSAWLALQEILNNKILEKVQSLPRNTDHYFVNIVSLMLDVQNLYNSHCFVRCDECVKCFHFTCLDPPVKKTPKRRGYSWHCADCDPTVSTYTLQHRHLTFLWHRATPVTGSCWGIRNHLNYCEIIQFIHHL